MAYTLYETFRTAPRTARAVMARKARVEGMSHGRRGMDDGAKYAACSNLYYAYQDGVKAARRAAARRLP